MVAIEAPPRPGPQRKRNAEQGHNGNGFRAAQDACGMFGTLGGDEGAPSQTGGGSQEADALRGASVRRYQVGHKFLVAYGVFLLLLLPWHE